MATNPWISSGGFRPEQNLYEDLVIESLQFYGQDVYYLPRELVNVDKVFMDDVPSRFSDSYKIEMYIENTEGFGGEGDLFSKFGVELRDQATFVVARRRWKGLIGDKLDSYNFRPREGDVLYIPWSKSLFEIYKVETETPFYQLNQLPTFRLQCELFEYNDEDFDTDIDAIDDIETYGAYEHKLTMQDPAPSTATAESVTNVEGQVTAINLTYQGKGYGADPTITVAPNLGGNFKFGNASLESFRGRGIETAYSQTAEHGSVEGWVFTDGLPATGDQQALWITGGNEDTDPTNRYVWGIDSLGHIVYSRYNNNGGGVSSFTGATAIVTTGEWHHIRIGVYDNNKMYMFFNGEEVLNGEIAGTDFNWISSSGYDVGAPAARTVDGVSWDAFDGYIDEFRAEVGSFTDLITPLLITDSGSTIALQTEEYIVDSATSALHHFNGVSAIASASYDPATGVVEGIVIDNPGNYYSGQPSITISAPYTGGTYKRGEIVTQAGMGYSMTGEVANWNDSGNELYLVHVGADDGQFHTFNTTSPVISESASYAPTLIEELQNIQIEAQNDVFDSFESDFLDFSEGNPFGDMS